MGGDAEWGLDGISSQFIEERSLGDSKPVFGSSPSSGSAIFYFTSDDKIYLFDAFQSMVYAVKNPTTVNSIIELVAEGKQYKIELEEVMY